MNPANIASGFRATDVYPFDRNAVKIPGVPETERCSSPDCGLAEASGLAYIPYTVLHHPGTFFWGRDTRMDMTYSTMSGTTFEYVSLTQAHHSWWFRTLPRLQSWTVLMWTVKTEKTLYHPGTSLPSFWLYQSLPWSRRNRSQLESWQARRTSWYFERERERKEQEDLKRKRKKQRRKQRR